MSVFVCLSIYVSLSIYLAKMVIQLLVKLVHQHGLAGDTASAARLLVDQHKYQLHQHSMKSMLVYAGFFSSGGPNGSVITPYNDNFLLTMTQ